MFICRRTLALAVALAALLAPAPGSFFTSFCAFAAGDDPAPQAPASDAAEGGEKKAMPGNLEINVKEHYVEFDAKIVFSEGDWVELIACTPNTLEYESLCVTEAKPSQIHLGLLMIGLEPGSPLTYFEENGKYVADSPYGPVVKISYVLEQDGKPVVVPANDWIVDQETGEKLKDNRWIFVGSRFVELNGKQVYLADTNGAVISMVNFTDETIVRDRTLVTNRGGGPVYNIDHKLVPKVGTKIRIRINTTDEKVEKRRLTDDGAKP